MLGRIQGIPRLLDDPVHRLDGRQRKGRRVRSQTPPRKEIKQNEGLVGQGEISDYLDNNMQRSLGLE